MEKSEIAKYLDLANHRQDATLEDIKKICVQVLEYGFNSVFVNPCYVAEARGFMGEQGKVGTVVSFPLGQDTLKQKIESAKESALLGADELDVCLNVGLIKSGRFDESLEEAKAIVVAAKEAKKEVIVKFIIETGLLTDEEIVKASQMVLDSGADFVKTCSGMGPRGATLRDVEIIRGAIGDRIKVKVAGGVTNFEEAQAFIEKGADRIGTSHAVQIVENIKDEEELLASE